MSNTKTNETPHERFKRLAEVRLNRFKNTCLLISNLSDSRYDYNEKEVKWYFDRIKESVDIMKKEFGNPTLKRSYTVLQEIDEFQYRSKESDMCDKFHRLMTNRINRLISIMNLLLNLVNRSAYNYYSKDIKQMFDFIDDVLDITLSHFIGIGDFHFKGEHDDGEGEFVTMR